MEAAHRDDDTADATDTTAQVAVAPKFVGTTNPRQLRALVALLHGPVRREAMDRITGSSNSPDVVIRLRRKGLPEPECLRCDRDRRLDRDGRTVEPGIYSLTDEGRRRVLDWIARKGMTFVELVALAEMKA